jgi:NADP-dependent 3-hydroxy acid dehydrogenase YdfG
VGGISGRRILVVGASSGMGRAIAVSLGKSGARVALTGRRLERLEEAAAEVGDGALPLAHDVREASSTEAVVARAADALGGLDALIYCAGIGRLVMLADAGADVWRETL